MEFTVRYPTICKRNLGGNRRLRDKGGEMGHGGERTMYKVGMAVKEAGNVWRGERRLGKRDKAGLLKRGRRVKQLLQHSTF